MVDLHHPRLSIARQCALVSISRSSFYYECKGEVPVNLALIVSSTRSSWRRPGTARRQMARHLRRLGYRVGREAGAPLDAGHGLAGDLPGAQGRSWGQRSAPDHRIYPHLLRGPTIDRANQVWSTDITYIPMRRGFLYLVAIMDWWSRKLLAWRLSNTIEADFCVEALEQALARHGKPEIFNSDQDS